MGNDVTGNALFETYVASSHGGGGKGRGVAAVSIAVHAVVVGALVFSSSWVISKLAVPSKQVDIWQRSGGLKPPPPPPGGERAAATSEPEKRPKNQAPGKRARAEKADPAAGDDTGEAGGEPGGEPGGEVGGEPGGIPGATGLGVGLGIGDDIGNGTPEVLDTKVVAPSVVRGLRISGTEQIRPPDADALAMERSGKDTVVATAKLCLNAGGRVSGVTMIKPSGFSGWDRRIRAQMRGWRYRTYRIGGRAMPVCTAVTFVYSP
jgi:protein TonB